MRSDAIALLVVCAAACGRPVAIVTAVHAGASPLCDAYLGRSPDEYLRSVLAAMLPGRGVRVSWCDGPVAAPLQITDAPSAADLARGLPRGVRIVVAPGPFVEGGVARRGLAGAQPLDYLGLAVVLTSAADGGDDSARDGANRALVAAHEVGHALGLVRPGAAREDAAHPRHCSAAGCLMRWSHTAGDVPALAEAAASGAALDPGCQEEAAGSPEPPFLR